MLLWRFLQIWFFWNDRPSTGQTCIQIPQSIQVAKSIQYQSVPLMFCLDQGECKPQDEHRRNAFAGIGNNRVRHSFSVQMFFETCVKTLFSSLTGMTQW